MIMGGSLYAPRFCILQVPITGHYTNQIRNLLNVTMRNLGESAKELEECDMILKRA